MLDTERYWQEEWAARVLRWARGKTRTAQEAEDLAQTVLLEWLRAVRAQEERGVCVVEPEHLLWRIARFVWCKSLRPGTYYRCEPLSEKLSAGETPEESAERQDEQRRQTAFVRRQIMRLSRIQRETLVWYYLENRTTADIARRLRVSENTVRWHLSDSRKKIREADGKMTSTEFVYCPKKLHVAINGEAYDDRLTREVLDNLLHQNILLRCYAQGQTAQELCDELGVARPYIEDAVNVLLRDELLTADGGRVRTNFIITSGAQEEARLAVYDAHKDELSREIVRQLMAHEQEIRAIGFIGCAPALVAHLPLHGGTAESGGNAAAAVSCGWRGVSPDGLRARAGEQALSGVGLQWPDVQRWLPLVRLAALREQSGAGFVRAEPATHGEAVRTADSAYSGGFRPVVRDGG